MPNQQQTAIVTGGGTGIGRAISLALARRGFAVGVIYARSQTDAEDTLRQIEQEGGTARSFATDVRDRQAVQAMVRQIAEDWGPLRYLVNNAAITRQLPFADLGAIEDEMWEELYATNVKGAFHCAQAAAPYLRQTPGAAILNIGSIAGETGYGSSIPYATSKAALHGLTRSLARALAPEIRVNCLAPGAVETRWWAGHEDNMRRLTGSLLLQRISTPEDIAETALMLLEARSMTGQILRAENGQTL
ncbi:SDR family NAD(P)-dependent oxidoreductase [Novosphingobium terrae]|jgi:3-oxoacyl-[acyl-carrier protein] reductase|uniref:SDR family NAD(P)-dependent oxidoreductase n=1 Tax=Novosphingobium terrae TaxID=2726189 RepID=UPI00197ED816|nr:SDR family oxidoreductase [Novosphingobium terrae]